MHIELANHFAPTPSIFLKSFDSILSVEEWFREGRPHEWLMVEESNGYTAWVDYGNGRIALTKGLKLIGTGKYHVTGVEDHEHVVLLDKEYYRTNNYLFFRVQVI